MSVNTLISRFVAVAAFSGFFTAAVAANYDLHFTITRNNLPDLTFYDLTLKVSACGAASASVTVDGNPVASTVSGGNVIFTTASNQAVVTLVNPTSTTNLGSFTKATLKGDKAFAFSMGFDDGQMLNEMFAAANAKGYAGTVFLMNKDGTSFSLTRNEPSWICDCPQLKALMGQGWSPGNHSYSHGSSGSATDANRMQDLLYQCISGTYPNFTIIAFAAPMFDGSWQPVINSIRSSGGDLQFNESGNDGRIRVDAGQASYNGWTAFSPTMTIGRDYGLETGLSAIQSNIDFMNTNANETRHFWYNTLSHGSHGSQVQAVCNYIYNNYGAGGSNKVWVAPSDQIYSYLLVRDNSTVTYSPSTQVLSASRGAVAFADLTINERTISSTSVTRIFDMHGRAVAASYAGDSWTAPAPGMYYVKTMGMAKPVLLK